MNKLKNFFWNLDDLFGQKKTKSLLIFQIFGLFFTAYIIFSPLVMDAKSINDSALECYEIIIICSYVIAFVFGILLNLNFLNKQFFGQFAKALIFILGRTVFLVGIAFIITFFIKLLCMIVLKIPPMNINKYNYINDIIWFFPIIQLIYFFIETKRRNSDLTEKRLV